MSAPLSIRVIPEGVLDAPLRDGDDGLLQFQQVPVGGQWQGAWVLTYEEPDGNGVDTYIVGGAVEDATWAIDQAEEALRRIWAVTS